MNEPVRLDTVEDLERVLATGMTPEIRQAFVDEFGAEAIRRWGRTVAHLAAQQLQISTESVPSRERAIDG